MNYCHYSLTKIKICSVENKPEIKNPSYFLQGAALAKYDNCVGKMHQPKQKDKFWFNLIPTFYLFAIATLLIAGSAKAQNKKPATSNTINLSGTWLFKIDSTDIGEKEKWYNKLLEENIELPGSMTTNNIGNNITANTPWTGDIIDSSWFFKPQYSKYRQPGNIKIPFWLQPIKYYKGAAWYQKEITIPSTWDTKRIILFLERCHWETTVWIGNKKIGSNNSLGTPHVYELNSLAPGKHLISIRVDNRIKDVNVGGNSHSISDHNPV